MSHVVKRIALDFNAPLREAWPGFVNPFYAERKKCPHCHVGYGPEGRMLYNLWYGHTMPCILDRDLQSLTSEPLRAFAARRLTRGGWRYDLDENDIEALRVARRLPHHFGDKVPTPREMNEWSKTGMGPDSLDMSIVTRHRSEMLGVSLECSHCNGSGFVPNPEVEACIGSWKETPPPAGEGWQVWGSEAPITPVFPTREGLIEHLVGMGYTRNGADAFTLDGWAPSGAYINGRMMSGIDASEYAAKSKT